MSRTPGSHPTDAESLMRRMAFLWLLPLAACFVVVPPRPQTLSLHKKIQMELSDTAISPVATPTAVGAPLSLNDADCDQIVAEADAVFDAIDRDGNGVISRDELDLHLEGQQLPSAARDSMFQSMDANADGVISRQELRDAWSRHESANLRLALGLSAGTADLLGQSLQRLDDHRTMLADELFDAVRAPSNPTTQSQGLTLSSLSSHTLLITHSHCRACALGGTGRRQWRRRAQCAGAAVPSARHRLLAAYRERHL